MLESLDVFVFSVATDEDVFLPRVTTDQRLPRCEQEGINRGNGRIRRTYLQQSAQF